MNARPSYRVDTVPTILKPFFLLYGYGVGLALYMYYLVQRPTITFKVAGADRVGHNAPYIFCLWHSSVPLALQWFVPHFPSPLDWHPHALMQHPLWYMKPIQVIVRLIGVKRIILGSAGHEGRHAADELIEYLRDDMKH
jgi:lysophospholipid acyltransferase (LPLAT)-like uncharacterized protein